MSQMRDDNNTDNKALEKLTNVVLSLEKAYYDGVGALKLEHMYGYWGLQYNFRFGYFLSALPPVVTIIMFVIFKRRKLLGVTQKFILCIMVMDLVYTTISSIRDILLRAFQMHYGFMEFRVCSEIIVSFRVQLFLHVTSIWLKTLMTLHQVLLIGFPFKVKQHNLSAYFYTFIFVHGILCVSFFLFFNAPVFEPVPLIQEFRPGYALKKILGCRYSHSRVVADISISLEGLVITYALYIYNQVLPFTLHCIIIVVLVVLLTKQIRVLSEIFSGNIAIERVKYILLMKVNIALGLSFVLQELPVIIFIMYQFLFNSDRLDSDKTGMQYQGYVTVIMSISFCIGKPIDLLIYSSLSKTFKEELKHLLWSLCKPCRRNAKIADNIRSRPGVSLPRTTEEVKGTASSKVQV